MESGKPTHFTIHTKGAGKAKPEVKIIPKKSNALSTKPEIIDNGVSIHSRKIENRRLFQHILQDSTYTVNYTPKGDGPTDVEVLYGGDEIPKSPFRVDVTPELNVNRVKVVGLPEGNS